MGIFKFISNVRLHHNGVYRLIANRSYSDVAPECGGPKITNECPQQPVDKNKKGLVLGVFSDGDKLCLSESASTVAKDAEATIQQHLSQLNKNQFKLGKAIVLTDLIPEYSSVALAACGPQQAGYNELEQIDEAQENVRWGVGAGVRALQDRGCGAIIVDPARQPQAAAEAATLAAWRFEEFKQCDSRSPAAAVSMLGGADAAWSGGAVRGAAQNWARFLSDMPANKMTPVDLAQAAIDVLCPLGVNVQAHDRTWIEAQNMQAFLTVARGSCEEPMFLECVYKGGEGPCVLIASKGVTFDSGGLCLKSAHSMLENRGSMAGAAVTLATLKALAELKVPINVTAVIPVCENMISGQCMKVGDVVRALNGLSIQIEDTDMEGRLMLADALVYGQAKHQPALVIDVATLTHGIQLATGGGAFGCFSSSAALWSTLRAAGAAAGDRPWRFPLWNYYQRQLTNDSAVDLRNKGSGKATPCLGAAFLKNFVCCDWVHIDTTGVGKLAHGDAPPYLAPRRMTGRPARTLVAALASLATDRQDTCENKSVSPAMARQNPCECKK